LTVGGLPGRKAVHVDLHAENFSLSRLDVRGCPPLTVG